MTRPDRRVGELENGEGRTEDALEAVYAAQTNLWTAVGKARQMGLSWEDIGASLGLSGSVAHQRYAHWIPSEAATEGTP